MELQCWYFKLLSIILEKLPPKMVKKPISSYKKGVISNYYKSKDFQECKREFPLHLPPGESVADADLKAGMISYDQDVVVIEFMYKKLQIILALKTLHFSHCSIKDYFQSSNCSAVCMISIWNKWVIPYLLLLL